MTVYIVISGTLGDARALADARWRDLELPRSRFRDIRDIRDPLMYIVRPMLEPRFVAECDRGIIYECYGLFFLRYSGLLSQQSINGASLEAGRLAVDERPFGRRLTDPGEVADWLLRGEAWSMFSVGRDEILLYEEPVVQVIRGRNDVKLSLLQRLSRWMK